MFIRRDRKLALDLGQRYARRGRRPHGGAMILEQDAEAESIVGKHCCMRSGPIILDHLRNKMDALLPAELLGAEGHAWAENLDCQSACKNCTPNDTYPKFEAINLRTAGKSGCRSASCKVVGSMLRECPCNAGVRVLGPLDTRDRRSRCHVLSQGYVCRRRLPLPRRQGRCVAGRLSLCPATSACFWSSRRRARQLGALHSRCRCGRATRGDQ